MGQHGRVDRAERLLTLVAELRWAASAAAPARSPVPLAVRELAARLGVSPRTLRRDLAELAAHGLPLRLVAGGASLVSAPATAVTPADGVRSLARPVVETVVRSVLEHRVVRIAYADESGERSVRDVEAHGLVVAPYGQYLVGWCRMREAPRTFRLDRIAAARLETGRAGRRDLEELLSALRVPAPRLPVTAPVLSGPGAAVAVPASQARAWTLERIRLVRERCTDAVTASVSAGEGAARLRVVLGHLAEWTRAQFADIQAAAQVTRPAYPEDPPDAPAGSEPPPSGRVAGGEASAGPGGGDAPDQSSAGERNDAESRGRAALGSRAHARSGGRRGGSGAFPTADGRSDSRASADVGASVGEVFGGGERPLFGRRPLLPDAFEGPLPYLVREAMIQDAMALRSFGELARDLDEVLMAAAHWVAECDDLLWRRPLAGRGGRDRFLADLLAGWGGPLAHVEWHLDQLDAAALGPFASDDPADQQDEEGLLVARCPQRSS